MLNGVYLNGRSIPLSAHNLRGEGGEARLYEIGSGLGVRILRLPNDPDIQSDRAKVEEARLRLEELQRKLPVFPKGLPEEVIAPIDPVYDSLHGGRIIGHTLRFVPNAATLKEYAFAENREAAGIDLSGVVELFKGICATTHTLHARKVYVGDYNPLNFLVREKTCYFIDTPSYQTPGFPCVTFMSEYVDPTLCKEGRNGELELIRSHSASSDWYGFWVILFEVLLSCHPYDGVYRPKDPSNRVSWSLRPLKRISVLHPEVGYPAGAIPWRYLSDEFIEIYRDLLERDKRPVPDPALLDRLRWIRCTECGVEHARKRCPACSAGTIVREVVRTDFESSEIFSGGLLRWVSIGADGTPHYVFHDGVGLVRQDGSRLVDHPLVPDLRVRLRGDDVIIGDREHTRLHRNDGSSVGIAAGLYRGSQPVFEANNLHLYWVENGTLYRDDPKGKVALAPVLDGQTLIWSGPRFGFGFFRGGPFQRAFLFDAVEPGERVVSLRRFSGRLVDMNCTFSSTLLWLFISTEERGLLHNFCFVVRSDGEILASSQGERGDSSWLGSIASKVAASQASPSGTTEFLLSTTGDDIVRLHVEEGEIAEVATFAGSGALVDSGARLLFSSAGLYVVSARSLKLVRKRGKAIA